MTDTTTTTRDDELGAALRALPVPEHRPSFYDELDRRLARPPRRRRRRGRLLLVGVAAVAVAALVALGLAGTEQGGPEQASAAEIKATLRTSLARLENLSGVLVSDGPQRGDVNRWRFTLTARGDLRLEGPTDGESITYDAGAGVVRSAQRSASLGGGPIFYAERSGVAPGLPDAGAPTLSPLDELGAFVRALLAANDPRVREIAYQGRPAWRLDVETVPNAIVPDFSGDRFELTIDRETGLPVRVVERRGATFISEIRIEQLAVDRQLAADAFRLAFPGGAEVLRSDDGFRRVTRAELARLAGYAPLVPAWVPEGYELAEIAFAREADPTGTEGGNPPSRMVVSLSYRRGLDQFLVTTRLTGGERWSDPLATGEGFVDRPERITLSAGALRGVSAELVIAPRGIPHLWAQRDELVVTVGGDLGRTELVRVAQSLD
jgi:hypothetical protein